MAAQSAAILSKYSNCLTSDAMHVEALSSTEKILKATQSVAFKIFSGF